MQVAAIEGPEGGAEAEEEVLALPAPEDIDDDCRSEELDHELDAALHGELRNAAEVRRSLLLVSAGHKQGVTLQLRRVCIVWHAEHMPACGCSSCLSPGRA